MAKPALGKGLGQLMAGQQAPTRKPDPATPGTISPASTGTFPSGKVTPVDFGRGLSTLVAPAQPEKAAEPSPQARVLLPAWFFFAADLLLLAFTVAICFDAEHPMQFGERLFAAVGTALGACLAIVGVLRSIPAE